MNSQTAPPSQKLPFASVDYEGGKPETYRGVTLEMPEGARLFDNQGTITFSGLGFESDLKRAEKCIEGNGFKSYLHSSSFDSFIQDQKRNPVSTAIDTDPELRKLPHDAFNDYLKEAAKFWKNAGRKRNTVKVRNISSPKE